MVCCTTITTSPSLVPNARIIGQHDFQRSRSHTSSLDKHTRSIASSARQWQQTNQCYADYVESTCERHDMKHVECHDVNVSESIRWQDIHIDQCILELQSVVLQSAVNLCPCVLLMLTCAVANVSASFLCIVFVPHLFVQLALLHSCALHSVHCSSLRLYFVPPSAPCGGMFV